MTGPRQPAPSAGAPQRAVLPRELGEFLIELSIALNKFSMYPGGHPSLQPAAEGLVARLDHLLAERGTLSVGVARAQLVIEGVATDAKNPVLKDLADRLHRHHLGAITFSQGIEPGEVLEFLNRVAVEADRSEQPLGLVARMMTWPHIRLYPVLYDRLELLEEEPDAASEDANARSQRTRAAQLWIGMARAALASEEPGSADGGSTAVAAGRGEGAEGEAAAAVPTDPALVAQAIESHPRGTAYDQVIVGYMLQIAEELRAAGGTEALQLRKRMSKLVSTLDERTLGRLLDMGGDGIQRRKFLLDASQGMAVDAVLELVQAAGTTSEQTVSHSMLRLLQKLARHAEGDRGDRRALAETSVRDQVADLIRGWSLKDPNPEAYRAALEGLSTHDPLFAVASEAQFLPEPRRIVEMALEVNVVGEPLTRAVADLLAQGQLKWLLERLTQAERSEVVVGLWGQVATVERLREVLGQEPLDGELVDLLLPRLGSAAAGPMLDALSEVSSAQGRRALLDRVVRLGADAAVAAAERLADERWYVQRNMLKIIGDLDTPPPGFRAADYLQHTDARVRREALRILLRDPGLRERAICRALGDPDERMVRTALGAALEHCPATAVPLVQARALSAPTEDLRVAAIRVLGASAVRSAVDTLLKLTASRKTLLGTKLPPKTPEYLAALAALRTFGDDPRAREVLEQGARSRDPEVARAAAGGAPPARP